VLEPPEELERQGASPSATGAEDGDVIVVEHEADDVLITESVTLDGIFCVPSAD
jgi:hypothetical protein